MPPPTTPPATPPPTAPSIAGLLSPADEETIRQAIAAMGKMSPGESGQIAYSGFGPALNQDQMDLEKQAWHAAQADNQKYRQTFDESQAFVGKQNEKARSMSREIMGYGDVPQLHAMTTPSMQNFSQQRTGISGMNAWKPSEQAPLMFDPSKTKDINLQAPQHRSLNVSSSLSRPPAPSGTTTTSTTGMKPYLPKLDGTGSSYATTTTDDVTPAIFRSSHLLSSHSTAKQGAKLIFDDILKKDATGKYQMATAPVFDDGTGNRKIFAYAFNDWLKQRIARQDTPGAQALAAKGATVNSAGNVFIDPFTYKDSSGRPNQAAYSEMVDALQATLTEFLGTGTNANMVTTLFHDKPSRGGVTTSARSTLTWTSPADVLSAFSEGVGNHYARLFTGDGTTSLLR